MAFEVGAIVSKLQLKKDQWDQSIKKVKADQKSLTGLVSRNSQQFKKMGRAMTVAGGIIVGSIGLIVKSYADFDQAMTESLAIMGDVSDETKKKMGDVARTISEETTYSAKELAEAYYYLASAGMDTAQSMTVLGDVARFAQAGAFDLAVATDLLTDAQTAMGLSSKDAIKNQKEMIRVSDVLVGANTLANASVLQFSEALTTKAAAALVNVNKELEEGVAVLAAFADKGIKGRLAGTQLGMMLNALDLAAMRNKKAWDAHGLTLWTATGEMKSMGDIIGELEGLLGDMTPELRSATLAQLGFTVKTKASILTLMGSSEKIKLWTKGLKEMGGKTQEVSDKQLEAFNNQLKLLRNTVTNAAISIGQSLAPMIGNLIVKVKEVAKKVSDWIKAHPGLTALIAKTALKVGVLLTVMGPLVMMLPGLAKGLTLVKLSFTSMLGPIGLVITGLSVIAIHAKSAHGAFSRMSEAVKMEAIASGKKVSWFKQAVYGLNAAWDKFASGIDHSKMAQAAMNKKIKEARENIKTLKPVVDKITKGFKDWFTGLIPLKKGLSSTALTAEDLFKLFSEGKITFEEYLKKLEELKSSHEEKLNPALKTTIALLKYTITPAMELARQFGEGKISAIEYAAGLQEIREEAERIKDPFKDLAMVEGDIRLETEGMIDSWNVLKAAGVPATIYGQLTALEKLKQGVKTTTKSITIQFRSMTERVIGFALDMGDAFGNFTYGLMDKGSTLGENLKGLWSDIGSSFKTFVSDYIADEAKKLFLGIVSKTKDMATTVTSGLAGVGKAVGAIGKGLAGLITTLASAIAKAASTLAAAAPSLLVVLGIALAAYAAFKLIGALFKKKPATGTMEAILRDISHIQLAAILDKMDESNFFASEMFPKIDYTNSILAKIENILRSIRGYSKKIEAGVYATVKKLGDLSGFQTGGYVPQTQLAMVHAGEYITPPPGAPERGIVPREAPSRFERQNISVFVKPLLIPRGDKYVVDFVIEEIKHGRKIPIEAVGG